MPAESLSKREEEIARLLAEGKSNKQIALALKITESTVEYHLKKIYAKLGVSSRIEAAIKLRETTGILGDSTVDQGAKVDTMESSESQIDLHKDGSNVNKRISLAEIIRFLITYRFPLIVWLMLIMAISWVICRILFPPPPWKFGREGEHPDEYTVGQVLQRSHASEEMVHGQFGTVPAWPAQPGYVIYQDINTPKIDHLTMKLRYSKYSASEVPILVFLDDEFDPRASIMPIDQGDWDKFVWTDEIDLGSVERGVHSIKFYTDGQVFGVADLDRFELTAGSP
jgi:DNA-binding CsgD family transcriptional regulator